MDRLGTPYKKKSTEWILTVLHSVYCTARKIWSLLVCSWLFITNVLFLRFKVTNAEVRLSDLFLIEGNIVRLSWKAKGYHRVYIKHIGSFPSNKACIAFRINDVQSPLEVKFFGVINSVTGACNYEGGKLSLPDAFMRDMKHSMESKLRPAFKSDLAVSKEIGTIKCKRFYTTPTDKLKFSLCPLPTFKLTEHTPLASTL